jgi:hypothetical protein
MKAKEIIIKHVFSNTFLGTVPKRIEVISEWIFTN